MTKANKLWRCLLGMLVALGAVSFAKPQTPAIPSDNGEYQWKLPKGFPKPKVPSDNPMTSAKVRLGALLFYDRRMSGNGTQSCATCHIPERAPLLLPLPWRLQLQ